MVTGIKINWTETQYSCLHIISIGKHSAPAKHPSYPFYKIKIRLRNKRHDEIRGGLINPII